MSKTVILIAVVLLTFFIGIFGIRVIQRAIDFFEYAPVNVQKGVETKVTIGAAIIGILAVAIALYRDRNNDWEVLECRRHYLREYGEAAFIRNVGREPTDEERQ